MHCIPRRRSPRGRRERISSPLHRWAARWIHQCAPLLPPGSPVFDLANPLNSLPAFEPFFTPGWGIFAFDPLAPRDGPVETIADDQVTGTAKLTWFPSDATMLYASYSTGFKSGGTNDDRINPVFNQSFGPETSESIELGFKGDIGPVRLSVAVYQTDYEDFQSQSFTGTGFNLQNAGDLETSGVEVEFIWRPFDHTEISGYYARNEGEYTSFEDGTCMDVFPFHTGLPDPGLQPSSNPILEERCSRTGGVLPYNPEDQVLRRPDTGYPAGRRCLVLPRRGRVLLRANTPMAIWTRSPLQDSVKIVNLRIGYAWTDWNADVTLWGRNITDERYFHGSFDAPAQEGHMKSYPSEPATYGITFRKNFD